MRGVDRAAESWDLIPLWFAFLGAPVIWAVRFGVSYALVPWACTGHGVVWMQAVTLTALAGTVRTGVLAWQAWRSAGRHDPVDPGIAEVRSRFMGAAGVLLSILFFLVIVAEALAIFLVAPCQTGGVPL